MNYFCIICAAGKIQIVNVRVLIAYTKPQIVVIMVQCSSNYTGQSMLMIEFVIHKVSLYGVKIFKICIVLKEDRQLETTFKEREKNTISVKSLIPVPLKDTIVLLSFLAMCM